MYNFSSIQPFIGRINLLKSSFLFFFLLSVFISSAQLSVNLEASFPGSVEFPPLRAKSFCTEIKCEITVTNTSSSPQDISVHLTTNHQDVTDAGLFQDNSTAPEELILDLSGYTVEANSTNIFTVYTRINTAVPFAPPGNEDNLGYDVTAQIDGNPASQVSAGDMLMAINPGTLIDGTGSSPAKVSQYLGAPLFPVIPIPGTSISAKTHRQNIHITGVLEIDVPEYWFTFSGGTFDPNGVRSEINMGEGAEIIVKSGSTLHLGAAVTSCGDQMWKSITVEDGATLYITHSFIEGGQYGIFAQDGARVIVQNTTFMNNFVGIRTQFTPIGTQNNINFSGFYGNTFTSDGNLKAPYPNQTPIPDELPYAGMELNNLSSVVINYTNQTKTTFSNLANGIVSYNSTVTLGNVDFFDIQVLPNTIYPSSGRGIYARATSLYHGLIYNAFGDSQFENCDVGIRAEGINVNLNNLTMNKVKTGIHIENSNNRFLQVNDNIINATLTGIFLNDNSFNYKAEVKNNIITMINPVTESAGIRGADMIDITIEGYGWDIENNNIDIGEATSGNGIFYKYGSFNNYIGNSVFTTFGELDSHIGYRLEGGSDNRVLCNTFDGNASSSTLSGQPAVGYDIRGVSDPDISCNEGHDTDIGILLFGLNEDALIRGNDIWNAGNGLQLGLSGAQPNAVIGTQAHHGNKWEIDINPDDNNHGAVNYGDLAMISQSEFIINDLATPPTNRTFTPSILIPNPNAGNANWFEIVTAFTNTYDCTIANTCPDGIGWHGFVNDGGITKLDEKIAQGNLATDGYDDSMNWIAKRHLFQKLQANDYDAAAATTPADLIIASFYTTESNTTIGQFNALDVEINNIFTLDAVEENNMLSQRSDIESKLNILLDLEEDIQSETLSGTELEAKLLEKESVFSALLSLDEAGIGFSEQVDMQRKNDLTSLLEANSNITTNYIYETNEKLLNRIYLTKKLKDEMPYSSEDIEVILGIANQCPLSGGDAVYKARAMMASIEPAQTYDDEILCQQNNDSKRFGDAKDNNTLQLSVQPNPTADILEVEVTTTSLDSNLSTLKIFVYNSLGQKMMEEEINYNEPKVYDVSSYDAGLYNVMIRNKDGVVMRSSKVIVISN